MSVRNLEYLLRPRSVAVVGASNRPRSIGATVMRNLIEAGFKGPIFPVNPKYDMVAGRSAVADVSMLAAPPEMAVICTLPRPYPG